MHTAIKRVKQASSESMSDHEADEKMKDKCAIPQWSPSLSDHEGDEMTKDKCAIPQWSPSLSDHEGDEMTKLSL